MSPISHQVTLPWLHQHPPQAKKLQRLACTCAGCHYHRDVMHWFPSSLVLLMSHMSMSSLIVVVVRTLPVFQLLLLLVEVGVNKRRATLHVDIPVLDRAKTEPQQNRSGTTSYRFWWENSQFGPDCVERLG